MSYRKAKPEARKMWNRAFFRAESRQVVGFERSICRAHHLGPVLKTALSAS